MENKIIQGSCNCQAVKYQISGKLRAFQYCHCTRCQKITGSAHSANIMVKPEQFSWITGEDNVANFDYPNTKYFRTAFCTTCGSNMPWMSKPGSSCIVPAGTLDNDPGIRPLQNVYTDFKACWYEDVSSLTAWPELPTKKE